MYVCSKLLAFDVSPTLCCVCAKMLACTPCIFTTVINILSTFTISSFLACHGRTSFTTVFIWPQAVLEAKVLAKALDRWRNCVNVPEKSSIMPAKNNYKACYCRSYKTDIFHLWFSTWLWYVQLFFLCITVNTVIIPYSVLISSRWLDATYKDIEFKNSSNTWKDIQGSKPGMALNRTSPIWELRASLAIHSLPATQHKWTCPALTPASKLVRFTYPKGCKA